MFKSMMKVLVVVAVAAISTSAMAAKRTINRTPREVSGVININTATAKQLELLPGIGRKTARLIVEHREKQPFKAPAEILNVKGIGEGIYLKVKKYVVVSGETTLAVVNKDKGGSKKGADPSAMAPQGAGQTRLANAQ
ncbi:MAG: ComEA family DNA-binding protein [Myxococcales bacterium]|jgi:competence protein ComEA